MNIDKLIDSSEQENNFYYANEYLELWLVNGILYSRYIDGLEINLDVAKKCVADRLKFCNYQVYPALLIESNITSVSKSALNYFFSQEGVTHINALAIHAYNVKTRIITNIIKTFHNPIVPFQTFTTIAKAEKWLQAFKNC